MFKRNPARSRLRLALLGCGAILGHSAVAQTLSAYSSVPTSANTETALSTIIVTARKVPEDIQAIPESITAIDANTIANAHLTRLDDLDSLVTNLNMTQRADNTPDVVMRGVGTYGVVQGVGFYVNDIQQFDGQTIRPDDIERIEVLKGPQGTLFGGSNVGGAIKYVTKLPSYTPTGEFTLQYGEFHDRSVDAVVSGPIVSEVLLARLSVYHDQSDGYLDDPTLNMTLPQSNETSGRLTLEHPGDQTRIIFYLSGDHEDSQNMNLYYTPPNDDTYERVYNGGVNGAVPSFKRDLYSPTLHITHDFGGAQFVSNSSYFHSEITSFGNFDKGALPPFGVLLELGAPGLCAADPSYPLCALASYQPFTDYIQDFRKNVISQELRLQSTGDSSLKWLFGMFAQEIDSSALQIQHFGVAPVPGSPVGVLYLPQLGNDSSIAYKHINRDYAMFGNASYDLDNWTLEAGLRIARFDNTMADTTGACYPCDARVSGVDPLPRASVAYHFTKDVMGYFTVARGDEEGDATDNPGPQGNQVQSYKTELALSYEAGVKSSLFDRHLTLNFAAFYVDYTNRIFEVGRFIGTGIYSVDANVGSSKNTGVEFEAVVRPTPELRVTGAVGVTRAIFGNATFLDGYGNAVNVNGNEAPNTPAYQVTLAVDWRHPLSDELVLGARIDSRFIGHSYWDEGGCAGPALAPGCPYAGYRVMQYPYHVVNAGVSLDVGKHWSVGAHVENLFNASYNTFYSSGAEIGNPFYNVAGINPPRQWFVSVTGRY